MTAFEIILFSLACLLAFMTFLPETENKHWLVRGVDFARIQVFFLLTACLLGTLCLFESLIALKSILIIGLLVSILFQGKKLYPFINFFQFKNSSKINTTAKIKLLSINVYQYNKNYAELINLVNEVEPDIFLAMETNDKWEAGLEDLGKRFKHHTLIPLENTYGMFFYSNMIIKEAIIHYFINEERPSIEAIIQTNEGSEFTFFGFHPPPPSPTEEVTSKKKDGELMILAKRIKDIKMPVIVAGDFNTVCWSNIALLFSKISHLSDARKKRGFHSTFPVKPRIFRIPIDLVFHSKSIAVHTVKTLKDVGSDHLPFLVEFEINSGFTESSSVKERHGNEADEIIKEGKEAEITE
jgi:endonuclease/exonuclease/phosphatase (EEP) superfamily protein YafD